MLLRNGILQGEESLKQSVTSSASKKQSASILMTHISEISALHTLTNFVITRPLHLREA